ASAEGGDGPAAVGDVDAGVDDSGMRISLDHAFGRRRDLRHSRARPGAAARRGSAFGRTRAAAETAIGISAHAVATVDDALELADRARQLTGDLKLDTARDAEAFRDPGGHETVEASEFDGADVSAGLDFHGHLVHPARAGEHELEARAADGDREG